MRSKIRRIILMASALATLMSLSGWCADERAAIQETEQTRILAAMRLPTYEGKEETKEFMQERANVFGYPCYPYHFRSFAGTFESGQLPWIKKEHTRSLTIYFDSLLLKGEFNEALLLKDIYERKPKYAATNSGGGFRKDMTPADVGDVTRAFEVYINQKSGELFDNLLSTKQYNKALFFATVYLEKDHDRANLWLEQIREAATTKVETLARTIQALETIPDLQAEYRVQADSIISSFPEGHELRVHLQARFDAIVTAPRAPIPGEAQQGAIRGMADRLFG